MELELGYFVDCASTAEWRKQVQERYPDDYRNAQAIELLMKLAPEVHALEGSALQERIERACELMGACEGSEIISEEMRAIGFSSFPASGAELVETLVGLLESAAKKA